MRKLVYAVPLLIVAFLTAILADHYDRASPGGGAGWGGLCGLFFGLAVITLFVVDNHKSIWPFRPKTVKVSDIPDTSFISDLPSDLLTEEQLAQKPKEPEPESNPIYYSEKNSDFALFDDGEIRHRYQQHSAFEYTPPKWTEINPAFNQAIAYELDPVRITKDCQERILITRLQITELEEQIRLKQESFDETNNSTRLITIKKEKDELEEKLYHKLVIVQKYLSRIEKVKAAL